MCFYVRLFNMFIKQIVQYRFPTTISKLVFPFIIGYFNRVKRAIVSKSSLCILPRTFIREKITINIHSVQSILVVFALFEKLACNCRYARAAFAAYYALQRTNAWHHSRRYVRAQVENIRGTNYPFLHGIIAADRDKAVRLALYTNHSRQLHAN